MPDINIEYDDLLSGDYILINNVGHFRSPKLKEMNPSEGIGWFRYNLYLFYLKCGREQLAKFLRSLGDSEDAQELSNGMGVYSFVIGFEPMRDAYREALEFFSMESITYNEDYRCFILQDEHKNAVGFINEENFDYVRSIILLLNYISRDKTNVDTKHSSKESEARWEAVQAYLAQKEQQGKSDESMSIGNMISKLCIISNSYNLLNVYDLTVFQLYDQFFQACYLRGINFTESIVSNHGSKDFKYEDWIKPVKNY